MRHDRAWLIRTQDVASAIRQLAKHQHYKIGWKPRKAKKLGAQQQDSEHWAIASLNNPTEYTNSRQPKTF